MPLGAVCPHFHTAYGAMEMMENLFAGNVGYAIDTRGAVAAT